MKSALIVWGGWDGHQPKEIAEYFNKMLIAEQFQVTVSDSLDSFLEPLSRFDLIVPIWTMGELSTEQCQSICKAVANDGVGLAGCHGGMCDAFRASTEWQFLTGGQWVAHPGDDGVPYTVKIVSSNPHPITNGLADFKVQSEQYYLHTDPANNVLAVCEFPNPRVGVQPSIDPTRTVNPCMMPTVWTKFFGLGRVFYNALGHSRDVLEAEVPREICRRGLIWASR